MYHPPNETLSFCSYKAFGSLYNLWVIDFLLSEFHSTPLLYGKIFLGILHLLRAEASPAAHFWRINTSFSNHASKRIRLFLNVTEHLKSKTCLTINVPHSSLDQPKKQLVLSHYLPFKDPITLMNTTNNHTQIHPWGPSPASVVGGVYSGKVYKWSS